MSQCPVKHESAIRTDLPARTSRIAKLPLDERGYPVPYFVAWIDGKPDFRIVSPGRIGECVKFNKCWVCGQTLGRFKSFVIGPMCAITRTTSEPSSHHDCAEWSVKACPFLTKPQMKRREDETTEKCEEFVPGYMIKRNPGVMAVWTCEKYKPFNDGRNGVLFEVGEPDHVTWWREGRRATRREVLDSIDTGIPALYNVCANEADRRALDGDRRRALALLPA